MSESAESEAFRPPDDDDTERTAASTAPGFLRRGVARGVDFGVQVGVLELAGWVSHFLPPGLWTLDEASLVYVDVGVGLSAMILGYAVAERIGGATVGKLVTGVRVVHEDDGGSLGVRGPLLRNIALLVDGLFFGLVAYSAMARSGRRQRVGDVWGRTAVVWAGEAPPRPAAVGAVVGVLVSFTIIVVSYLIAA